MIRFSVIITSRNRPALLRRALASVRLQRHSDYEIVVVDDGSAPEFVPEYKAIATELDGCGRLYRLPASVNGSGPSASRNHALRHCRGEFVAFLDDDDEWVDADYLGLAAEALKAVPNCDLHLANQRAIYSDGRLTTSPVWIEDVTEKLPASGRMRDWSVVPAVLLLLSDGFCHLNSTIVRRHLLLERLGGFDETMAFEEDRDLYLRAIEAARCIVFSPRFIAQHHVPDAHSGASASTKLSTEAKIEARLRVLDKAIAATELEEARAYCRRLKGYLLRRLALCEARLRNFDVACAHAHQALSTNFNCKWLAFSGWLWIRRVARAAWPDTSSIGGEVTALTYGRNSRRDALGSLLVSRLISCARNSIHLLVFVDRWICKALGQHGDGKPILAQPSSVGGDRPS